jgi:porin
VSGRSGMPDNRQLRPGLARAAAGILGAAICLAAVPAGAQPSDKGAEDNTRSRQGGSQQQQVPPPAPPAHLLGDWGGARSYLDDRGIDLQLDYTTETAANVSGGRRQGIDYAHQIGLQADIDWEKLAGLRGFSTHTIVVNRAGRNTSTDYIGDNVIQAQEIYGAGFSKLAKLVYFYGEEKLWDGRGDVAAGRLAVGADFAASPLYCNFMTLTICGHPRGLTSNQGFTDWPTASWGGRIRVQPTSDTYLMAGLYESTPFPPGGPSGWDWSTSRATGEVFPAEIAWEPVSGPDRLQGHYKLGIAYDNSSFTDNFYDAAGRPFLTSGAPARRDQGRVSVWATADRMVMRNGPNPNDGLILLGAYAHNSPDVSLFEHFAWVGLLDRGFWRSRPQDQLGLAATYYRVSRGVTRREEMQGSFGVPFTGGIFGVQSDAFVLEANYDIPVYRGIDVQPELEYFIHPGGQAAVPNAFVLGLKTHVLF